MGAGRYAVAATGVKAGSAWIGCNGTSAIGAITSGTAGAGAAAQACDQASPQTAATTSEAPTRRAAVACITRLLPGAQARVMHAHALVMQGLRSRYVRLKSPACDQSPGSPMARHTERSSKDPRGSGYDPGGAASPALAAYGRRSSAGPAPRGVPCATAAAGRHRHPGAQRHLRHGCLGEGRKG